ncbi:FHA domain-containing protein [Caballeronia arationis]|jgi:predicted Zn finger-like uncharacterized protein|uniref:DUF3426 domain-containing protein n=1 Tax=Caballeronia arationis TaxID=1777142 RepID=UPI00074BF8B7|nr:DUF3426 domain-containing protein [Caballeronia arationis]SAK48704.1 FHA domain-containing protein [Caballeronia arationis]
MALATRCPHCDTVFRLDPHLLAPHDGRVRCGHCQEVFDAAHYQFELAPDEPAAPAEIGHASARDEVAPAATAASAGLFADARREEDERPPVAETPLTPGGRGSQAGESVTANAPAEETPADTPHEAAFETFGKPHTKSFVAGDAGAGEETVFAPFAEDLARNETAAVPAARHEPEAKPAPLKGDRADPSLDERPEPFVTPPDEASGKRFVRARTGPFVERPEEEQARRQAGVPPEAGAERFADTREEPFVDPSRRAANETERPAPGPAWPSDPEPRFNMPPSDSGGFSARGDGEAAPYPAMRETVPPWRSPKFWKITGRVAAVVLAVTLVLQLAWWQRETVIVYFPHAQSIYVTACEQLGCIVTPPRDIDGLQIENSGLRQVDGPHKLELKLSLRNRYDVALAYPALELTLLDDKNNIAIRRVLWPQDYARPGTIFATGLPARSTQPVIVRLDTGDAVAANYRVQVFYP